jgi:hypothetical protein
MINMHGNNSFESIKKENVKQIMYGRPNEGRNTMKSDDRVDRDTRGVLTGW